MRSEAEKIEEQLSAVSAGPEFLQLNDHFQCAIPSFYSHYFYTILHMICYIHNVVFVWLDGSKGSEFDWLCPAVRC